MFKKTMVGILFCALLIATCVQAQEQRRVRPAFPIGAGEKMQVWSGDYLAGNVRPYDGTTYGNFSSNTHKAIMIDLPVGTTLKRVLGDFVDQNAVGGIDLTIELLRVNNTDPSNIIVMRTFTTSGILSTDGSDIHQVVSNPLSHSMLQGWTYYIDLEWPGTQAANDLQVSVIKLVYEP